MAHLGKYLFGALECAVRSVAEVTATYVLVQCAYCAAGIESTAVRAPVLEPAELVRVAAEEVRAVVV